MFEYWYRNEQYLQNLPQVSQAQYLTLHKYCMGQLMCIENCMGKAPIVKKGCVNDYLN